VFVILCLYIHTTLHTSSKLCSRINNVIQLGHFKFELIRKMNTIKSLITKSSKYQSIENTNSGLFQTGALEGFNTPSIVDIVVINKNITEVIFKATVITHEDLAGEPIRLRLENTTDIVETFLREELDEFYKESARLQELISKAKINTKITKFLLKTWKETIEDTEDHLMESAMGEFKPE
jgi:hypothetical protein